MLQEYAVQQLRSISEIGWNYATTWMWVFTIGGIVALTGIICHTIVRLKELNKTHDE